VAFTLSCSQVSCSNQRSPPNHAELNARALGLSPHDSSSTSNYRSRGGGSNMSRNGYRRRGCRGRGYRRRGYRRTGSDESTKQPPYETFNQANLHNHPYRHSTETDHMDFEDIGGTKNESNLSTSIIRTPDSDKESKVLDKRYGANKNEVDQVNLETEGNPVIYRYFGRSRARSVKAESIPFLVLGPKVDEWKPVGRILASKGFNVMTCEQILNENNNGNSRYYSGAGDAVDEDLSTVDEYQRQVDKIADGEALIVAVLDALQWKKAVIVGCDRDAVLAIEAALRLAPERIAGLVLCGDLTDVEDHIGKQILSMQQSGDFEDGENLTIGSFLRDYVTCPCTVISDGISFMWPTDTNEGAAAMSMNQRIIGGGLSPHRQLPEQFSWALSRFVESRVTEQSPPVDFELSMLHDGHYEGNGGRVVFRGGSTRSMLEEKKLRKMLQDKLPPETKQMLGNIFSSNSQLLAGRFVATAIAGISLIKVCWDIQGSMDLLSHLGKLGPLIGLPFAASRSNMNKLPIVPDSDVCDSEIKDIGDENKKDDDDHDESNCISILEI